MITQLPFFEISTEPLVVATILDMGKSDFTQKVISYYTSKGKKPFFVLFLYHCVCVEIERQKTKDKIKQLFADKDYYIVLSNTKDDDAYFKSAGMPSIFCHQNCFLDEHIFDIQNEVPKYDAIYVAQAIPFKRIELTDEIPSLALLCYANANDDTFANEYVAKLKQTNTRIINQEGNEFVFFSPEQVAKAINQAKYGLILSATEGANFATTEYLLCGKPVISTPSKGGREVFFTDYNHIIVNPDATLIREAVSFMDVLPNHPQRIRNEALELIYQFRKTYNDFIHDRFPTINMENTGRIRGNFVNKLMKWQWVG